MALSIRTTTRNNRAEEINTDLGASAKTRLYSGTAPASVNDAPTGDLLAECIGNTTKFGTVTNGTLAADNLTGETYCAEDTSANMTGTVGYVRIANSAGTEILQYSTVGITGSGQEVILPTLSITELQPVQVQSIVVNEGNA